jgi:hypothetical protein
MPKLTPQESKEIGGADAQIEKQKQAAAKREAESKVGKSVDSVTFKKGPLKKGTRVVTPTGESVVGEPSGPAGPKVQLSKKEKPKRVGSVKRGAGGRIESARRDITVPKKVKPTVRRGKGGRAEKITPVAPNVPTAGPEVMGGQVQPRAAMRTTPVTGRTQLREKNKGFAQKPAQVGELLRQAMVHLDRMKKTQGTPEFHEHHNNFNEVHATLQKADPSVHTLLGIAAFTVRNPGHPDSEKHFKAAMSTIRRKISGGLSVREENIDRAKAGQARARAARIAAEKAKKEGNA